MPGHRLPSLKARRIAAGLTITALAKQAAVSDWQIVRLESRGNCLPHITQRILDALGPPVAITSSSVANPSVIATATHKFVSTDTVTIAGHTGSTPAIDGDRVATKINATSFSIPINVTVGGTGGTARMSATALGIVRL